MESQNIMELEALTPTEMDAGLVFSGVPTGNTIWGFQNPCLYTPAIDPHYSFHESARDAAVWFMNKLDPLYLYGPTGSGKTSLIKQLAARLNYPIFEVTGHGRLEFADLCGHISLHNGTMRYEYGPLSLAMRYGGLFLINEVDLFSPEVAVGLNGVLEGAPLCLPENGGEVIHPHEMFRIACTGNTNGGGDDTGLYQGTGRMNLAWLDRFMLCEVNYPDAVVEKALLVKLHPALPEHIVVKMVDFANEIRKQFIGASDSYTDTIEVTLSTRTLLRWADLTLRFQPLAHQGIQSRWPTRWTGPWAFGRPGLPVPCCMNSSSGCSRWTAIWGSENGSGNHAGAMADLNSRAYGS